MFKENEIEWENSDKTRQDKIEYMKKLHNDLMEIGGAKELINKDTIISGIGIDGTGTYISLNEYHSKIKMYIHENDYEEVPVTIAVTGNYEKVETEMVLHILNACSKEDENLTVFDIGANVGWYSLNLLSKFPNVRVYSFEPSPLTYKRLVNNLKINRVDSAYSYNIGFYDKNDKMDFFYDSEGSGASSLTNIREKGSVEKIEVDVMKMDSWTAENKIDKIDFIKCDVEGAEFFVFKGGKNIIEKSHPIIFSEMLRKWSAKFGYTPNDIITFFGDMGYECYIIRGTDKLKKIDFVDANTEETNFFFLHKEKHKMLIQEFTE